MRKGSCSLENQLIDILVQVKLIFNSGFLTSYLILELGQKWTPYNTFFFKS